MVWCADSEVFFQLQELGAKNLRLKEEMEVLLFLEALAFVNSRQHMLVFGVLLEEIKDRANWGQAETLRPGLSSVRRGLKGSDGRAAV